MAWRVDQRSERNTIIGQWKSVGAGAGPVGHCAMHNLSGGAQQFSTAAQRVLHRGFNRPRLIICELFADQLSNLNAILMRTVLVCFVGLVEVECREDKGQ